MKRALPLVLVVFAACSSQSVRDRNAEKAKEHRDEADGAYKRGAWQAAIESYTRAIELNPDFAEAYYWRGNAWSQLAQSRDAKVRQSEALDSAIRDFGLAANRNPMHFEAYLNRACLFMVISRPKEAVADLLRCCELRTKDPQPHLLLGQIYETRFEDRGVTALEHYEKYVDNGGTNDEIVERVRQFRDLKKSMAPAPKGKEPTAEEEKAAKETHDKALALLRAGKRAEAVAALDELLAKYGHTQYVKTQGPILQKMRDAMAPKEPPKK